MPELTVLKNSRQSNPRPKWGLHILTPLRNIFVRTRRIYLTKFLGIDIDPSAQFSLSAKFDHNNPMGIHIGAQTYIAFHALILAYDFTRELYYDTFIGKRCFIGARSIILPGVTIGDDCVIGSGSVVMRDIPARSLVGGNPARIIRSDIKILGAFGRIAMGAHGDHRN
jgi:acetyltransferase-like isoleucine patch superfamily enzyme